MSREITAEMKQWKRELFSFPGVNMCGFCDRGGDVCFRVGVVEEHYLDMVPDDYNGIPVEKIITGVIRPL